MIESCSIVYIVHGIILYHGFKDLSRGGDEIHDVSHDPARPALRTKPGVLFCKEFSENPLQKRP